MCGYIKNLTFCEFHICNFPIFFSRLLWLSVVSVFTSSFCFSVSLGRTHLLGKKAEGRGAIRRRRVGRLGRHSQSGRNYFILFSFTVPIYGHPSSLPGLPILTHVCTRTSPGEFKRMERLRGCQGKLTTPLFSSPQISEYEAL